MSKYQILNSPKVANVPWQDKPKDAALDIPVWRYTENPIINRNPLPGVARDRKSVV